LNESTIFHPGLYRGWWITVWREIPGFGIYFALYEHVKHQVDGFLLRSNGTSSDIAESNQRNMISTCFASALAGGCTGSFSWAIIYPLDVIKSRIQTAPLSARSEKIRVVEVARTILKKHGWTYMFRGLGTTVFRAFPVNGIIFPIYELTLIQLGKQGL